MVFDDYPESIKYDYSIFESYEAQETCHLLGDKEKKMCCLFGQLSIDWLHPVHLW